MAVDLATVHEVEAGPYTVRVGHGDGTYEAAVLSEGSSSRSPSSGMHPMMATMTMVRMTPGGDDGGQERLDHEPIGPTAEAPHEWVAVGLAIELYEWQGRDGGPEGDEADYKWFGGDVTFTTEVDAEDVVRELAEEGDDDE